ncbi:MAG: hypothetical protein HUU47_00095 [Bacteroidetes bacterium]|nr:hypothetical protein [Bacteroidota bacterium]
MIDLKNELEIIITKDHSPTIINKKIDETYHSINDALQESMHVFIENGIRRLNDNTIKVFEVGFGTGLNSALTMKYALENKNKIYYQTIDLLLIKKDIITEYFKFFDFEILQNLQLLNKLKWNNYYSLSEYFGFEKNRTTLQEFKSEDKY